MSIHKNWAACQHILCIRADNMGDVMMSSPAIRALKETIGCKITMLTSSKGKAACELLAEIDAVIVFDAPWVKHDEGETGMDFQACVEVLKSHRFDACVLFTVYSQNPMPAMLLAYLAEIPNRLAYCRENPYHLLTEWVAEEEPYTVIKHQVQRDLDLVARIGVYAVSSDMSIAISDAARHESIRKRSEKGFEPNDAFLVFHCGVSEKKRRYPRDMWVQAARLVMATYGFPILFTGAVGEKAYIEAIQKRVGGASIAVAGLFSIAEFAWVLKDAAVVVTVNTGTVHICAALGTPMVVLYARTNPQHTPWMSEHRLLDFSIPEEMKSMNEVVRFVDRTYYADHKPYPSPEEIGDSVKKMLCTSLKTALKSG